MCVSKESAMLLDKGILAGMYQVSTPPFCFHAAYILFAHSNIYYTKYLCMTNHQSWSINTAAAASEQQTISNHQSFKINPQPKPLTTSTSNKHLNTFPYNNSTSICFLPFLFLQTSSAYSCEPTSLNFAGSWGIYRRQYNGEWVVFCHSKTRLWWNSYPVCSSSSRYSIDSN